MEEIVCECGTIINKNDKFHNSSSKHRRWINKINKLVALLNNSITDGVIVVTPAAIHFNTNAPVVAIDPRYESSEYPSLSIRSRQ